MLKRQGLLVDGSVSLRSYTMEFTHILSGKTTVEFHKQTVKFIRNTYNGVRYVFVPREVVEWAIEIKAVLDSLKSTLELTGQAEVQTPVAEWKLTKSEFKGAQYVGFVKYQGGLRIG